MAKWAATQLITRDIEADRPMVEGMAGVMAQRMAEEFGVDGFTIEYAVVQPFLPGDTVTTELLDGSEVDVPNLPLLRVTISA